MMALAFLTAAAVLWHDPGPLNSLDMEKEKASMPRPPYTFLQEDMSGTSPKVWVLDETGVKWRVKGGRDGQPETFISRFVRAVGYYTETTYFLPAGRIEKVPALKRASGFIKADGSFTWASFEKLEPDAKFTGSWSWVDPEFKGTRELNGLKILVMLFSNWDNKDVRDHRKGSNTSILEFADGRQVYFVNDWGQSFGGWGRYFGRANWNCRMYQEQTPIFVAGVKEGRVQFGYGGAHTADFKNDIRVEDVRWLMEYVLRISDSQLHTAFEAAAATQEEEACFTRALRNRIEQLRRITLQ